MIITQTPLRLSLLGGNTDFPKYFNKHGGAVLTMAINKYVYCIVKERFDDEIRVNYSIKEIVNSVSEVKHDLVREAMKLVGVTKGIEITFLSDIPSEGSGLGSSSAVTIGILNALHNFKGESVTKLQLAEEACKIEVDILKKPIGFQDQYACAFGGLNLIEFSKEEILVKPIELNPFFLKDFISSLSLFYTNKTRDASSILSKMKLNKKILDQTKDLVLLGILALGSHDIAKFGKTLDIYWNLKKKLNSAVTDTLLDEMYNKILYNGAYGGKIVGAGGGGFFLSVSPENRKGNIRNSLNLKELPVDLSRDGTKVIFNIQK